MAILTAQQLAEIRQAFVNEFGVANQTKPVFNAAIQAIEDVFVSATLQNAIGNAINTATSPVVLTAEQKRLLVRWWLYNRYLRGNQ